MKTKPHTRVSPMPPTIARLIDEAEAECVAAYEAVEVAYEAGSWLARARWDARPHSRYAAWGNGWVREWAPGEYKAALAAKLAAWDASHETDRQRVEAEEAEANARNTRACKRLASLAR